MTTKKYPKLSVPKCPLCRSKIFNLSIDSGNKLKTDKNRVVGVIVGISTMQATCAQGCVIFVRAADKPGITGELAPMPKQLAKKRGPIPRKHQAKRSGALKPGWR